MKALSIIHDEHQAIAAVIHGMRYLMDQIREHGAAPNFDVLGAMIYYIDAFPERFHHPKEDAYLFPALRIRHPEAGGLLDRLEKQHIDGAQKIRTLEQLLTRYRHGGQAELAPFAAAVDEYAKFHWEHMRTEEDEVLPLAEKHLLPSDWQSIDAAFADHSNPMLGVETRDHFAVLFRRIVNLAPPPIGVGPANDEAAGTPKASRWLHGPR